VNSRKCGLNVPVPVDVENLPIVSFAISFRLVHIPNLVDVPILARQEKTPRAAITLDVIFFISELSNMSWLYITRAAGPARRIISFASCGKGS